MTFILDALSDRPVGLFQMDDTSPLQDYSGYNRTATVTGTPAQHAALVKGATYAPVFTDTVTATIASPVFKQGYEHESFTLAAWVRVVGTAADQQILGTPGGMDGLLINGTVVSFVTKLTTAPEVRCSFDTQKAQTVFVVGVHTENKNSLYVNGLLVDETSFDEIQALDTFQTTSANLSIGDSTGTQGIAVNGVSIYAVALSGEQVLRQYLAGTDVMDADQLVSSMAGEVIPVSLDNADDFVAQVWDTTEEWEDGAWFNVGTVNDQLVPMFTVDTSMTGQWLTAVDLDIAGTTSIYGVLLDWDGEGVLVDVSLDGTTWEAVTRGVKVTTVPAGFDPTDELLQIRVRFPGGIVDDTSYLKSLSIVGLRTNVNAPVAGRTATYTNASPEYERPPLAYDDDWGVSIASGGNVVISADTLEAVPARTIELWIKRTGANPTISMTGTTYQNGATATATLVSGQWTLMHVVAGADVTGGITITGPAQLGQVTIYETALTAIQIASIYNGYVGANALQVPDNSTVTLSESAAAAQIYAHDWSISGAG